MEKKAWNRLAENPSPVEIVKDRSNYLRGTLRESLAEESSGSIAEDDQQLIKFHGIYQQDDRDRRTNRLAKKLEPLYSFMIRIRIPAGILEAGQWIRLDDIADRFAGSALKLTTRQAVQFHGVIKFELRETVRRINQATLSSIAACGDVNRNVMCTSNPALLDDRREVWEIAEAVSEALLPSTRAYHEIWLTDATGEKTRVDDSRTEEIEPLYGKHYLPRKFKIALSVPPVNDTDVFSNDLGLIAIVKEGRLQGFNVCAGGGLGMTFGNPQTYPRLADAIGYCPKKKRYGNCPTRHGHPEGFRQQAGPQTVPHEIHRGKHGAGKFQNRTGKAVGKAPAKGQTLPVRKERGPVRLVEGRARQVAPHPVRRGGKGEGRPRSRIEEGFA